ncbi:MAG: hypothetical protein KJ626_16595 [Verrucomicrobia bacterium]|nr:hypothetical protein [Verrucomicrobiota bacterium]
MKHTLAGITAMLLTPLATLHADNVQIQLKAPITGLAAMGDIRFHREEGGRARSKMDDIGSVCLACSHGAEVDVSFRGNAFSYPDGKKVTVAADYLEPLWCVPLRYSRMG